MWWNETARRWERHPDCRCDLNPCVCSWLRPLDQNGRPIQYPAIDAMRERQPATKKKDAA